jgi:hypothetical protein
MGALYGRALARAFLDVDAAFTGGRYTRERLVELLASSDAGFDRSVFADVLGAISQITDAAFAGYGIGPAEITAMRKRFAAWRDQLRKG